MWTRLWLWIQAWVRPNRFEADLAGELEFHIQSRTERWVAEGVAPAEARRRARLEFGGLDKIKDQVRDVRRGAWLGQAVQDARYGLRSLRRTPGVAAAILLMLAVGIGANAAMYGLLAQLFLQAPPHIENPDSVHRVYVRQTGLGGTTTNPRMEWDEFSALRTDTIRFSVVAGYTYPTATQHGRGQASEELYVSWVTGEFFRSLGVHPAVGRRIGPADDRLAATPAAVISDGYWHRRFGGGHDALGATVTFDGVTYTIIGVTPPGFSGPDPNAADVWLPLLHAATGRRGEEWRESGSGFWLTPLVRLAPDITPAAAGSATTTRV